MKHIILRKIESPPVTNNNATAKYHNAINALINMERTVESIMNEVFEIRDTLFTKRRFFWRWGRFRKIKANRILGRSRINPFTADELRDLKVSQGYAKFVASYIDCKLSYLCTERRLGLTDDEFKNEIANELNSFLSEFSLIERQDLMRIWQTFKGDDSWNAMLLNESED